MPSGSFSHFNSMSSFGYISPRYFLLVAANSETISAVILSLGPTNFPSLKSTYSEAFFAVFDFRWNSA